MSWTQIVRALHFNGGANTAPVQIGDESAERAVLWFRPDVIVPTVNVDSAPRDLRARRSEPDEDADDPSDDVSVSVLCPPRTIDPEVVGDSRNRHNRTVRLIHQLLRTRGKRPIKPAGWFGEQPDVVWREHQDFTLSRSRASPD